MIYENDFEAMKFLRSRGYTQHHGIIISTKIPDDDEMNAINYLCAEWDYGYEAPFPCE